jgi:hypothetical protein
MLTVEVLAELRRAGFPLTSVPDILDRFSLTHEIAESKIPELFPNAHQIAGKWYLEPTIEQIIDVLGEDFQLLERTDLWGAIGRSENGQKLAFGPTAIHALANLYLEIKKK